jgi:hypothetical protein
MQSDLTRPLVFCAFDDLGVRYWSKQAVQDSRLRPCHLEIYLHPAHEFLQRTVPGAVVSDVERAPVSKGSVY